MAELAEIREILKSLAISQKETDEKFRETDEKFRETDEKFRETDDKFRETDDKFRETKDMVQETKDIMRDLQKTVKQVTKQLGELGNKFGTFAEGMALPAMERVLRKRFGATHVGPRAKAYQNGSQLEIDVLGYANGTVNTAVVVEIKSHLRDEHVDQLLETLARFPHYFPDHANKRLYGILAGVHAPESICKLAMKKGLFVARITEDNFELAVPRTFEGKDFQSSSAA
jgi:hypothetical protein